MPGIARRAARGLLLPVAVGVAISFRAAPALSYPGAEALSGMGDALIRFGRLLWSPVDDLRTRAGIRRLPWIGKFWRPDSGGIPPEIYNRLYPRYIEVCTMTQYVRVVRDESGRITDVHEGGWGGHATMFLNGACRDASASRPRLRICDAEEDLADPDSGVGVSVNQVFGNLNWMAFAGRRFFLSGGVAREELLDEARFDRSVREAARSGLFDAVELREDLRAAGDGDPPTPERIVRASIGTDFALTLARTLYCSRLPVPETVLAEIVAELNALNDRYDGTGERYRWDPIEDNCSHAIHNAIAASGVWDPKRTRLGGVGHLRQFTQDGGWHLSFPFNSMVRLAEAGNARPIDDVFEAFRDTDLRRTFDRHGWVSTRHGALVDVKPIHEEGRNLLFREGKMPFAGSLPFDLPEPVRRTLSRREIATLNPEGRFRELFSGAEYRSIRENLERYRRRYRAILADAQSPPDSRRAYRRMSEHEKREFLDFRTRFHAYVREQLRDVEGKLVRYGELERASAMAPRGASRRPRSPRPGPPTARAPSRRGYQPPGTAQRLRGRKAGSESPPSQNRVAHPGAPA